MNLIIKGINYVENGQELGDNLKYARKLTDLSQENVGKIINIERSSISYYEIGKSIPSIFTLICLSWVYGTTVTDLLVKDKKQKDKFSDGELIRRDLLRLIKTLYILDIDILKIIPEDL